MLAGMARGTLHRVVSNADTAFQRFELALSGYYLLGVEPGPADRDGPPPSRRREVGAARADHPVAAHVPVGGRPAGGVAIRSVEADAPLADARHRPCRSGWRRGPTRSPGPSRVRLLVAAEADARHPGTADLRRGCRRRDQGRQGGRCPRRRVARPAHRGRRRPPWPPTRATLTLDPGTYRLRVALANEEKRVGSVEREVPGLADERRHRDGGRPAGGAGTPRRRRGAGAGGRTARLRRTAGGPGRAVRAAGEPEVADIAAKIEIMRDEAPQPRVLVSTALPVGTGASPEVRVALGRVNVQRHPPRPLHRARDVHRERHAARRADSAVPDRADQRGLRRSCHLADVGHAPPELSAAVSASLPALSKDDLLDTATTNANLARPSSRDERRRCWRPSRPLAAAR